MDYPTVGEHTSLRSKNDGSRVMAAAAAACEEQLCKNQRPPLSPFQPRLRVQKRVLLHPHCFQTKRYNSFRKLAGTTRFELVTSAVIAV
jgi:hypothetical protein